MWTLRGLESQLSDGPERSDPFRYQVQLRWADVDALGHVNNVAYAAYFDEARRRFLGAQPLATLDGEGRVGVDRQEVTYLSPLMVGTGSISVACDQEEGAEAAPVVVAELFRESPEGKLVHARSRARLGRRAAREGQAVGLDPTLVERAHRSRVVVRFADLSPQGDLADTSVFEYLQEARIALMAEMDLEPTSTVVAQKNVDFYRPAVEQPLAFDVWSWVARVGNRSMTIESVVSDGGVVFARGSSTLVFFDHQGQRSIPPSPAVIDVLRAWQL